MSVCPHYGASGRGTIRPTFRSWQADPPFEGERGKSQGIIKQNQRVVEPLWSSTPSARVIVIRQRPFAANQENAWEP